MYSRPPTHAHRSLRLRMYRFSVISSSWKACHNQTYLACHHNLPYLALAYLHPYLAYLHPTRTYPQLEEQAEREEGAEHTCSSSQLLPSPLAPLTSSPQLLPICL
ncbi:hypothetical protein KC19_2G092400 [Ceratodon purpureus]|uniref:Uncharacterized protein n=1 Tax=Ceratodon purpureus TaxID=3225 RepID=A0A8T0IUI1_CERPU|nr:hypothetical protein KC19_2G092400 [Ceratodon purpureus]